MHAFRFELIGDLIHVNAQRFQVGQGFLHADQILMNGNGCLTVVAEGIQRLRRHGVDRIGGDQRFNVDHVAIVRIFGAGRCPQGALCPAAFRLQSLEPFGAENDFIAGISQAGAGDGSLAAQAGSESRILSSSLCHLFKLRIDLGIDPGHKERRHGGNRVDGQTFFYPLLQAAQVGIHHSFIPVQRKNQGHVDIDARRDGLLNRRDTCLCGRNFNHQVRPVNQHPQPSRF